MPKLTMPVTETENSVLRPVVLEIVRKVMALTDISNKSQIYYPSDINRVAQPGTTLTPMTPNDEPNSTDTMQRVTIEVDEQNRADALGTVAVNYAESRLFFADQVLGVTMKPVYIPSDVTITFKFRAQDETMARRWRDRIRVQQELMQNQFLHEASYNFHIPVPFLVILKEIHRLREAVDGYGDTFDEYLRSHLSDRATVLTTQIGTMPTWAVAETARRVVGFFDFTGEPEKGQFENGATSWTCSFDYKFGYEKPAFCHMTYPLVVHQQVIKYVPNPPDADEQHVTGFSLSSEAANYFEAQRNTDMRYMFPGYAIPSYDEFIPRSVIRTTMRIATILTGIDPAQPLELLNLGNLPDLIWKPSVLQFMRDEASYMTKPFNSLFNLDLYRNLDLLEPGSITINSALDVRLVRPQSLRDTMRVRFSVFTDWRLVNPAALDRARNHGAALLEIIQMVYPWLSEVGALPMIMGNDYISKTQLEQVISVVNRGVRDGTNSEGVHLNTVATLFIVAKKAAHYAHS